MHKSYSLTAALLVLFSSGAFAAGNHEGGHSHGHDTSGTAEVAPASTEVEMVDGEVRKVDAENKKITVKHGDIKNLQMPGMTMVFRVKDPAMLSTVKVGDKVRFAAEKLEGAIVITQIQPAK